MPDLGSEISHVQEDLRRMLGVTGLYFRYTGQTANEEATIRGSLNGQSLVAKIVVDGEGFRYEAKLGDEALDAQTHPFKLVLALYVHVHLDPADQPAGDYRPVSA